MTDQNKGFKNHKEMWGYLIGGGEICLVSNPSVRAKMENGSVNTPYNIGAPAFWMPYEEPKWYENIPEQGILCRVWCGDKEQTVPMVRKIIKYDPKNPFTRNAFLTDEEAWEFAEPLTYQEAIDLIYKPLDT